MNWRELFKGDVERNRRASSRSKKIVSAVDLKQTLIPDIVVSVESNLKYFKYLFLFYSF